MPLPNIKCTHLKIFSEIMKMRVWHCFCYCIYELQTFRKWSFHQLKKPCKIWWRFLNWYRCHILWYIDRNISFKPEYNLPKNSIFQSPKIVLFNHSWNISRILSLPKWLMIFVPSLMHWIHWYEIMVLEIWGLWSNLCRLEVWSQIYSFFP